jgi:hypothetical protein
VGSSSHGMASYTALVSWYVHPTANKIQACTVQRDKGGPNAYFALRNCSTVEVAFNIPPNEVVIVQGSDTKDTPERLVEGHSYLIYTPSSVPVDRPARSYICSISVPWSGALFLRCMDYHTQ